MPFIKSVKIEIDIDTQIEEYKYAMLHTPIPIRFYKDPAYTPLRLCKLTVFGSIMNKYEKYRNFKKDIKIDIMQKIECGCNDAAIDKAKNYGIQDISSHAFNQLYDAICFNVATNLDFESTVGSRELAEKILNQEQYGIDPYKIGFMSSIEMAPSRYIEINKKIDKLLNIDTKIKTSELHKCAKCKKNECIIERNYCRALDEGIPLRVICMFCGHSWNG